MRTCATTSSQAYEAVRGAYGRVSQRQVADEADLRRQEAPEGPSRTAPEPPRRRRRAARGAEEAAQRGGFGRILLVGIVGAGLALALSEGLRKKVLDALFGAEEEFEYTSTTSSPTTTNAASGNSGATSSTAGTTPAG